MTPDEKKKVDEQVNEQIVTVDKAKKKKKRKRKSKKKKSKEHEISNDNSLPVKKKAKVSQKDQAVTDTSFEPSSEVPLEGSMIGGTMVLINRKEGKVFSALERLENGKMKEIGYLSKTDGSIVLQKSEKGKHLFIFLSKTCMYRSRLGCLAIIFDRSNIMLE